MEMTFNDAIKACVNSKGFVAFFGIISDDKDENGDQIINYHYFRTKYSMEDLKPAVEAMKNFVVDDIKKQAVNIGDI